MGEDTRADLGGEVPAVPLGEPSKTSSVNRHVQLIVEAVDGSFVFRGKIEAMEVSPTVCRLDCVDPAGRMVFIEVPLRMLERQLPSYRPWHKPLRRFAEVVMGKGWGRLLE